MQLIRSSATYPTSWFCWCFSRCYGFPVFMPRYPTVVSLHRADVAWTVSSSRESVCVVMVRVKSCPPAALLEFSPPVRYQVLQRPSINTSCLTLEPSLNSLEDLQWQAEVKTLRARCFWPAMVFPVQGRASNACSICRLDRHAT